jgi:hypothetical protein
MKTGKDYLEAIRFSIPLKDIFEVVDSCHYNYDEEYCPVLLKLGKDYDKDIVIPEEEAKSSMCSGTSFRSGRRAAIKFSSER